MKESTVMADLVVPRAVEIVGHHVDHVDVSKGSSRRSSRLSPRCLWLLAEHGNIVALSDEVFASSDGETDQQPISAGLLRFFLEDFLHRLKTSDDDHQGETSETSTLVSKPNRSRWSAEGNSQSRSTPSKPC